MSVFAFEQMTLDGVKQAPDRAATCHQERR
jgi:hypothetical protein